MRAFAAWVVIGSLALPTAGCSVSAGPNPQHSPLAQARAAPQASYASGSVLRPNDLIRVQVYNEPTISGDYQVDGSGFVSIPLAGRIRAAGVTTAQLERAIAAQLNRDVIKDPRVNVQVATYAPFYIHGEVKRSGEFPYRPGLTVMDAVAIAGGYTYRADERKVYVRRAGTNIEEVHSPDARVPVFSGDNIRIPERFF